MLWLDVGKPVTKSNTICDQGRWGMGRGCNNPCGDWCFTLAWAQTEQAETKFCMSSLIFDHQNFLELSLDK